MCIFLRLGTSVSRSYPFPLEYLSLSYTCQILPYFKTTLKVITTVESSWMVSSLGDHSCHTFRALDLFLCFRIVTYVFKSVSHWTLSSLGCRQYLSPLCALVAQPRGHIQYRLTKQIYQFFKPVS